MPDGSKHEPDRFFALDDQSAMGRYLAVYQLEASLTLLRLDGQYGTGAVLSDLAGFAFVTRGKSDSHAMPARHLRRGSHSTCSASRVPVRLRSAWL